PRPPPAPTRFPYTSLFRSAPHGPMAPPAAEDATRPGRKAVRIYPYAVSRNRLERAIRDLRVPAYVSDSLQDADVVLTLKSQERRDRKSTRLNSSHQIISYA